MTDGEIAEQEPVVSLRNLGGIQSRRTRCLREMSAHQVATQELPFQKKLNGF